MGGAEHGARRMASARRWGPPFPSPPEGRVRNHRGDPPDPGRGTILILHMIVIKSNWYLLLRLAYTLLGAYFVSTSSVVGQTHWEWQNPWPQGSDIWAVCFVNADSGFTVGQAGTINRTTDGGVTWLHCKSGTVADLFDVSFSDAYHGTAVGKIGTIVRTTDGGLSWALQTSGTSGWFRAVSFVNTQSGTAG